MAPDDLVEAETGERTGTMRGEERPGRRRRRGRLSEQPGDRVDGLRPERANPPFVALAVEAHPWLRSQVEMLDAQVGDLLHARAGIIEHEEEGAVAQGVSA